MHGAVFGNFVLFVGNLVELFWELSRNFYGKFNPNPELMIIFGTWEQMNFTCAFFYINS